MKAPIICWLVILIGWAWLHHIEVFATQIGSDEAFDLLIILMIFKLYDMLEQIR